MIVDDKVKNEDGDKLIQVINANELNDDEGLQILLTNLTHLVNKYEFPIDETIHFSSVQNKDGHVAFCWRGKGNFKYFNLTYNFLRK